MVSSYQAFVKQHMAGKTFGSRTQANAAMREIAAKWKASKGPVAGAKKKGRKGGSLFGDVAGEVLSGSSNLARRYL